MYVQETSHTFTLTLSHVNSIVMVNNNSFNLNIAIEYVLLNLFVGL